MFVGGERGQRLKVSQAGGALAQLITDRGALLLAPGGLQGGAQRRELLAQGGGFSADPVGERDQEFLPAIMGEPSALVGDRLGVRHYGGELADPAPGVGGRPFRLRPGRFPQVRDAGRQGGAGGRLPQGRKGLGQRDLLLDQR
jgi:hypothetical protein